MDVTQIRLPSRLESVDSAAEAADKFAKGCGFSDELIYAIDLAIRESVANAVKHGNKFDESKDIEVTFAAVGDAIEVRVRDFGTGFAVSDVPDPTDPENLLKSNGRGILFMNSFMDEVAWENPPDGGMAVRMVKRRVG